MHRAENPASGGLNAVAIADVAVIGGSFAGISAALMLARGRRSVTLFDSGVTRNRFSAQSHGLFGHDGTAPDALRLAARAQVLAYPTVALHEARVTEAVADGDSFHLTDDAGHSHAARRLLLATGQTDILPPLPGLAECWGITAVHCPYCHGYELADRPTAVLMLHPAALHQVQMLAHWTADRALFLNGRALEDDMRRHLTAEGVAIHDGPVAALLHDGGHVRAVVLEGGQQVACGAVYLAACTVPASDLGASLGCAVTEGPLGRYLVADEWGVTSVPGLFAAGDLARPMPSAPQAVADGAKAGVACHRSLMRFA